MLSVLADLGQAVGGFAAFVALILVWGQLREQTRQRKYAGLADLHEQITAPDVQAALRFVYAKSPEALAVPSDATTLSNIEAVLNLYDLIGRRVQRGLVPEREAIETEWPVVLRLHGQLAAFMMAEEELRPGAPFKPGFKWLVRQCEEYKKQHFPHAQIKAFGRSFQAGIEEG